MGKIEVFLLPLLSSIEPSGEKKSYCSHLVLLFGLVFPQAVLILATLDADENEPDQQVINPTVNTQSAGLLTTDVPVVVSRHGQD
jgi:hypothetical protein